MLSDLSVQLIDALKADPFRQSLPYFVTGSILFIASSGVIVASSSSIFERDTSKPERVFKDTSIPTHNIRIALRRHAALLAAVYAIGFVLFLFGVFRYLKGGALMRNTPFGGLMTWFDIDVLLTYMYIMFGTIVLHTMIVVARYILNR